MIKIDALDTLFFRDGKPFTMGQETWATGLFPPPPSIYYGALRTAYFAEHFEEFSMAGTPDDSSLNLRIKGIFYGLDDLLFLPLPLDVVKDQSTKKLFTLQTAVKTYSANVRVKEVLVPPNQSRVENVDDGIISVSSLERYLSGDASNLKWYRLGEWVTTEPKIGIKRSRDTKTVQEGMLYRADMRRLERRDKRGLSRLSIYLDVSGLELPSSGFIRLGGEGKIATFEKVEEKIIKAPELSGKRFKIYLATPSVFMKGWLPKWIDEETLEGEYGGIPLKLVTAAIGKPVSIGGYDMKKRIPKTMYRAVPAGSIYYFEIEKGHERHLEEIKRLFHGQPISDVWPEQGFGIAYVGRCPQ